MHKNWAERDRLKDDPTQEQIKRRAEKIRRKWSERVRKRRFLGPESAWLVPLIHVADIEDARQAG